MLRKCKPALEKTPGYIGGRLRAHTGHDISQFVAVSVMWPGKKNAKKRQIVPDSMITLMLCVRGTRRLVVHADSLWISGIKTSQVCPQTRNDKRAMVISVVLVLIHHGRYTHGAMKTPWLSSFCQPTSMQKSISATLSEVGNPHIVGKP